MFEGDLVRTDYVDLGAAGGASLSRGRQPTHASVCATYVSYEGFGRGA